MTLDGPSPEVTRATSWVADEVLALVRRVFAAEVAEVAWIGSGHWSDCFALRANGAELVIRVGSLVEDFHKDRMAAALVGSSLPTPRVVAIGPADDTETCFYAISERVHGIPVEQVQNWRSIIPSLVDLLESLRSTAVEELDGWGRWDASGQGQADSWRQFLLSVDTDPPVSRVHGWRRTLIQHPDLHDRFEAGYELLRELASEDPPRSLVHNDLFNRNAHIIGNRLSGVFDWGNSMLGDHLYDLAILSFWEPWWDNVEFAPVLEALRVRWTETEQRVHEFEPRFRTCLLHIGLEHMAYHCYLNDMVETGRVADRMDQVLALSW